MRQHSSYNAHRPRDLSRFEAFRTWHSALYREVESTSVTPYAPRARDKALHAPVVALARHLIPALRDDPPSLNAANASELLRLCAFITARAGRADETAFIEQQDVARAIDNFVHQWKEKSDALGPDFKRYWSDSRYVKTPLLISWEEEAQRRQRGEGKSAARPTPNSMRDVEPSVWYRLVRGLRDK